MFIFERVQILVRGGKQKITSTNLRHYRSAAPFVVMRFDVKILYNRKKYSFHTDILLTANSTNLANTVPTLWSWCTRFPLLRWRETWPCVTAEEAPWDIRSNTFPWHDREPWNIASIVPCVLPKRRDRIRKTWAKKHECVSLSHCGSHPVIYFD